MTRAKPPGIALIVIVGLLVLMSLAAAAMTGIAGRLRVSTSIRIDHAHAWLLARSGVEYAAARLCQGSAARFPPTPENQSDDWACRDEPGVPLERTLNPSYAQTEPYQDLFPNGKYDGNLDAYTDLNGNGRFDAWSGRLRGTGRMAFVLKVSGDNAEGGINVNTGWLGTGDANQNGLLDFQDPEAGDGRNPRIVYILDQLSGFLRMLNPDTSFPSLYSPDLPVSDPQALANRAQQEAAFASGTAQGIAQRGTSGVSPGLQAVTGHAQQTADEGRSTAQNGSLDVSGGADSTRRQALKAPRRLWAGIGSRIVRNRPIGGYQDPEEIARLFSPRDWDLLRPHLSILGRRNRYAENRPFAGWDLGPDDRYLINPAVARIESLAALYNGLALISSGHPAHDVTPANALAIADFLQRYRLSSWYRLYCDLHENRQALFSSLAIEPEWDKPRMIMGLAKPEVELAYNQVHWSWQMYDSGIWLARTSVSNADDSATGSIELGFEPPSLFSIDSLGRVADPRGNARASARFSALSRPEGLVEARSQSDFENTALRADPDRIRVIGRPEHDRTVSWPCFSGDACPDLPAHDCPYYGEVMLLDRSWIDPGAEFYQPNWDLHQPLRPSPAPGILKGADNFGDVAGNARWSGQEALRPMILSAGSVAFADWGNGVIWPIRLGGHASPGRTFLWAGSAAQERFPLVDGHGALQGGTLEGYALPITAGIQSWGEFNTDANGGWWRVKASPFAWVQNPPSGFPSYVSWNDSAGAGSSGTGTVPHFAWVIHGDKADLYRDGIWRTEQAHHPAAEDTTRTLSMGTGGMDEARLYAKELTGYDLAPRVLAGRFWIADSAAAEPRLVPVPGFTSPLYVLPAATSQLGYAGWDGFMPVLLQEAFDQGGGSGTGGASREPLRVELLLYPNFEGVGDPVVLPFPADSWRNGGCRTTALSLWRAVHPDQPFPRVASLRYRVWLDGSALDRAWKSPTFDDLVVSFKSTGIAFRVRER